MFFEKITGRKIYELILSVFFLSFGIYSIAKAYSVTNPFLFIILFFSSNFMILISCTIFASIIFGSKKDVNKNE